MFQLTCPHCEAINEVSAAKAGGEIMCGNCQQTVAVPKLGELRDLPTAVSTAEQRSASADLGLSGGRSMAFASLGLVCLLSLLGAVFCGVNWSTIEVPMTTESHLALLEQRYGEVSSAQLIREFEDITQYGVDIPVPLQYRVIESSKQAWGQKTLGFLALALLSAILAVFVGRRSRAEGPAA